MPEQEIADAHFSAGSNQEIGIRLSGTVNAATYSLFRGNLNAITPRFDSGDQATSSVVLEAADVLAQLERRTLASNYVEQGNWLARGLSSWCDTYTFDPSSGTTSVGSTATGGDNLKLGNVGVVGSGLTAGTATIIPSSSSVGAVTAEAADGILLEGQLAFAPSVSAQGPILRVDPSSTIEQVDFFVRIPVGTLPAPGSTLYVLELYAGTTSFLQLRLAYNAGICELRLYDSPGTGYSTLVSAVADGVWRKYTIYRYSATHTAANVDDANTSLHAVGDLHTVTRLHFGGSTAAATPGKNLVCPAMDLAGVGIRGGASTGVWGYYALGAQPKMTTADRLDELVGYSDGLVVSGATTGSAVRYVVRGDTQGQSLLEAFRLVARSAGGVLWTAQDGTVTYIAADALRTSTVAATIQLELDDDRSYPPVARRAVDSRPTKVTVTCPAGTVSVVDDTAKSGAYKDVSLDTVCPTTTDAAAIGAGLLASSASTRLTSLTVDLATAQTDLYSAVMVLAPGARLHITGLSSSVWGWTTTDAYVQGWSVTITSRATRVTFDLSPADSPVEAIFDTHRFAAGGTQTVTSGTAVGSTSNGTLVITTSSGATLTTDAGAYPQDLDWNGERVTITSAPAGSSSPQTVTTTSRGVAPSVARSHAANETVEPWQAAAFTY